MLTVKLGKTGIVSPKNAFGALPVQRVSEEYAAMLLRKAYEAGIRFFDTARAYSDSERKVGLALGDVRENVYIATKTGSFTVEGFWRDLNMSLATLGTDYIDIYQFHNPPFCPKLGDGTGLYEAMLEAKAQGKIRHIGITNHRLSIAREAVESGLYETLQFPFSYLCSEKDVALVRLCEEQDVGFIAMKGLSGGLITDSSAAYAYIAQFSNVLPIWGVQHMWELEEFLAFFREPAVMTDAMRRQIECDRTALGGDFCRGCGYCMPCPVGIKINDCARMSQMIRRAPKGPQLSEASRESMERITQCIGCGACKSRCPYGLDVPELLKRNLADYRRIVNGEIVV